jgi:Putative zinc-finger
VTCLEVRERLTEHALGLLSKVEATEVARHLEWCAGCRKESAELEEGASRIALALPIAQPPSSLETRVVDRLRTASGRIVPGSRRRMRVLLAATLAAALLAMGATGWAIAERGHVQTLKEQVTAKQAQLNAFANALESVRGRGTTFKANLAPALGGRGGGSAIMATAPGLDDFVFIDVLLPGTKGPFWFQIVSNKSALKAVRMLRATAGSWIRYWPTNKDLSGAVTITVLDDQSRTVLSGTFRPYAAAPSEPAN